MNEVVMNLVQQAVAILLQILLIGVLAGLVWIRSELKNYIVQHTTAKERDLIARIGQEAFTYAETVFAQSDGPAKLNEAIKYMLDALARQGKSIPMKEVRSAIESAWMSDKRATGQTSGKSAPLPPPAA
ncbi:phage holin [Effusibacillus dendaii]|uniref:Phage holin n=1 Tax=Effusibacillus dendaii TaxID=2743772 RepID=A0A7I8DHB8_9BACL|nr:phage holin [Effusibacillus dendaii]BCJ88010.1 hypothetical protein skT53_29950 [Effusibacillus dendaii]